MHTKEPWATAYDCSGIVPTTGKAFDIARIYWPNIEGEQEWRANAARIVSCVNAMAGIPGPAAYVAAFEAMVEAGDDALKALVGVDRLLHKYGMMDGEDCPAIEPLRAALQAARIARGDE